MEYFNLTISLIAVLLSVTAIIIGRRKHLKEEDAGRRAFIAGVMDSLSRNTQLYEVMKREREKTGGEFDGLEKELFDAFEKYYEVYTMLYETLEKLIQAERISIADSDLNNLRYIRQRAENMSLWFEFRYDRFKRFNDNRIPELVESTRKIADFIKTHQEYSKHE